MPLDRVSEVVTPQPVTRVPGCGREVCGLVGFRGRVVTVFDLGVLGGAEPAIAAPDHRLVLVEHRGRLLGLAVEAMVTVAAGAKQAVQPAKRGLLEDDDITGTVVIDGRTFATLDVDHLLGRLLA
ncbi:MAG: chemotaxis protein CheW [Gemmatimonadetes bacterium]|nr:chemotaxis protein CheW [Gemmatimonadota bacterium]